MKALREVKEYKNIKEIIYNSVEKFGNNTAFIKKHQEDKKVRYEYITYNLFLEDINSLGTKLFEMGLKNKRIAIVGRNRYEWVLIHLTNLLGGIVSVPLDKDLQLEELENSLIRSNADVVVFDEKYIEKIESIKNRSKTNLKDYICMSKLEGYKDIYELKEEGKS